MTEPAPHPATFRGAHLVRIIPLLDPSHVRVLDPFAGVGKVFGLADGVGWDMEMVGVEIEEGWAKADPRILVGSVMNLDRMFPKDHFDAVVTSPTFGNRMADHHDAKDGSYRRTYRHLLGQALHDENSGKLQWGPSYRGFHEEAWWMVGKVLRPGGRLVLNMGDHIRGGERQYVIDWHTQTLQNLGYRLVDCARIAARGYRYGANHDLRTPSEVLLAFDLKESSP